MTPSDGVNIDTTIGDPVAASQQQANAAQVLGALFGLPLYNGTNALGQPYSNQLKPGADYLAKRTAQAAYNEGVTNAFAPKGNYMPSWAVQQPAANWLNKGFDSASYFPNIAGVRPSLPTGAGQPRGTNLGFGALFGSLAPSTQLPGGGAPGGTYTPPELNVGPVTRPPGGGRVVPPPYIGGGGETRIPNPAAGGTTSEPWYANPSTRPTTQQQLATAGVGGNYGIPSNWNPGAGVPAVGTPEFSKWLETPSNFIAYQKAYYEQPQPAKQAANYAAPNEGETFFEYVLRTGDKTGYPLGSMGSLGMKAQPLLDKGYSFQETLDRIMRPTAYMTPEEYRQEVFNGMTVLGLD